MAFMIMACIVMAGTVVGVYSDGPGTRYDGSLISRSTMACDLMVYIVVAVMVMVYTVMADIPMDCIVTARNQVPPLHILQPIGKTCAPTGMCDRRAYENILVMTNN